MVAPHWQCISCPAYQLSVHIQPHHGGHDHSCDGSNDNADDRRDPWVRQLSLYDLGTRQIVKIPVYIMYSVWLTCE